jgi:hypothetical protein
MGGYVNIIAQNNRMSIFPEYLPEKTVSCTHTEMENLRQGEKNSGGRP